MIAGVAAAAVALAAAWVPADLRAASAPVPDARALCAAALARTRSDAAQRLERYTYTVGGRTVPVEVRIDGDDVRARVMLGAAGAYDAGRRAGREWRADANGVAHFTRTDAQGDAADRLPWSRFPFAPENCALAGEAVLPGAAWVVADRTPFNTTHFFFIDKAAGRIVREQTREGRRVVTLDFDDFRTRATVERPQHWRVSGARPADDIDVRVESSEPAAFHAGEIAPPSSREVFAFAAERITLPARFAGNRIFVDAETDGHAGRYILDTGTAGIILDRARAERWNAQPLLEHASVGELRAGGATIRGASVLSVPFAAGDSVVGILGYDCFFGHVVHVDYAAERVELLHGRAAAEPFEDPRARVVPIDVAGGLPLAPAVAGNVASDGFALDTGSPRLYVMTPFVRAHAAEIERTWRTVDGPPFVEHYLEGSIRVADRRVDAFDFGGARFAPAVIGVQQADAAPDAIEPAFDGIIGTDVLARFDLWFDYDRGRLALRPR